MTNTDIKEYPYLSQTRDFALLKDRYSENTLKEFEAEIRDYVEAELSEDYEEAQNGLLPVVAWYAGLLATNDLFGICEPDKGIFLQYSL